MSGVPEERAPTRAAALAVALGLALLCAAVFAPAIGFGFVDYDDDEFVPPDHPALAAGLSREGVVWAFTSVEAGNWVPLTRLSWLADVTLAGGVDPQVMHASNVAWHTLAVVLLFAALFSMTGALSPSAFAAALFAVHPLRVESVAWVSERRDVVCGAMMMATLLAYARHARHPGPGSWLLVLAGTALALLAKPLAVTLPFVLLLLDAWPLQRLKPPWRANATRLVVEKLPLFALAAANAAVTVVAQRSSGSVVGLETQPLSLRVGNALLAITAYLRQTVWPAGLAAFYPHSGEALAWAEVAVAAVLVAGLTAAAVLAARRGAGFVLVGWLFFLGALVPMLGIVQVGAQAHADRYTYWPHVGLAIAIAWGGRALAGRLGLPRAAVAALALAIVLVWGLIAARQVRTWHDSETLFAHALAVTQRNWIAHMNLGALRLEAGDAAGAWRHFAEAARFEPNQPKVQAGLAESAARAGRLEEAIAGYRRVVAFVPPPPGAQARLAHLLLERGRPQEALAPLMAAQREQPESVELLAKLGEVQLAAGRTDEGIASLREALRRAPALPGARAQLGVALLLRGHPEEAQPLLEVATGESPDTPTIWFALAQASGATGRSARAAAAYRSALRLRDPWPEAQNNLAWLLATDPDPAVRAPDEAILLAERAVAATERQNASFLDTLAVAYAAGGRLEAARDAAREAAARAREAGEEALAEAAEARAREYERAVPGARDRSSGSSGGSSP